MKTSLREYRPISKVDGKLREYIIETDTYQPISRIKVTIRFLLAVWGR